MSARETPIHIAIVGYLRTVLPHGFLVHHSAGGGLRTKREAALFKAMGLTPGYPDLVIHGQILCKPWTGFLEIKAPALRVNNRTVKPAGALSLEQMNMLDRLADCGFPTAVVKSIDEARIVCREWGLPLREVLPQQVLPKQEVLLLTDRSAA